MDRERALHRAGQVEAILVAQIELVGQVIQVQRSVYESLRTRAWEHVESFVSRAQALSREFLHLDKRCFLLLQEVRPYGDAPVDFDSFFAYLRRADVNVHDAVVALYRTLRSKVASSKNDHDAIQHYLTHARGLAHALVSALTCEQQGSSYTKDGCPVRCAPGSLVFDRVL